MTQPLRKSISIQYVLRQAIIDIIDKIKLKSNYGHDEISKKLMNATITYLIDPITQNINQSLQTCIVPK